MNLPYCFLLIQKLLYDIMLTISLLHEIFTTVMEISCNEVLLLIIINYLEDTRVLIVDVNFTYMYCIGLPKKTWKFLQDIAHMEEEHGQLKKRIDRMQKKVNKKSFSMLNYLR